MTMKLKSSLLLFMSQMSLFQSIVVPLKLVTVPHKGSSHLSITYLHLSEDALTVTETSTVSKRVWRWSA